MRNPLLIGVCGCLSFLLVGGARSLSLAVIPSDVAIEYYSVTGTSLESLRESLRSAGPRDDAGGARIARTDWNIRWRWELLSDGSPDVRRIATTLELTLLLPRWIDEPVAPKDLQREWQRYLRAVVSHESEHIAIARQGFLRLQEELGMAVRSTHSRPTADALNKMAHAVLADIRLNDREFDRRTKHGTLAGVTL